MRRLLWGIAISTALFLLVTTWALATSSGARFLLRRADAAMPATLAVAKLDGSVWSGLRIGEFRFQDDGVQFDAKRLEVELRVLPLLARRLYVDRIFVDGAKLRLWASSKPDEPYLAMQLPVRLKLEEVLARDLVIEGLREQPIALETLAFAGTWIGTLVRLDRLVIQAPQGRLAFNGKIDLANLLAIEGNGTLRWQSNGVAWRAALATREHASGTGVGLAVTAPLQAEVTALLAGNHQDPRWQARVRVPEQVLSAAVTQGAPVRVALDLRGGGAGFDARVGGNGNYAGESFVVRNGRLRSTPAMVFVDALELALPERDARLKLSGRVARDGKRPDADLALSVVRFPIPASESAEGAATVLDGRVGLRGWLESWQADAQLQATREELTAAIDAKLRGTPQSIAIESARIDSEHGGLALSGEIGLVAGGPWHLRGHADNFDPSALAPDWSGEVDATFAFEGARGPTQPIGKLTVSRLGGTLRGRPVAGEATIELAEKRRFAGTGSLRSGESRVAFDKRSLDDGRVALTLDVRSLGDLLPNARGRIEGDVVVDMDASPPSIDGNLTAAEVAYASIAIGALQLDAQAPRASVAGRLTVVANSVAIERLRIERVALDANGTAARHSASLTLDSAELDIAMRTEGGFAEDLWRGRLLAFDLEPRELAPWSLREPVEIVSGRGQLSIEDPGLCLTAGGRDACLDVDFSPSGELAAHWKIDRLPSAAIARALELAGVADFDIDSELS
ncbi:MAG: hypothetical protein ABIP49_11065, partial [Lysobacterales bacterium]